MNQKVAVSAVFAAAMFVSILDGTIVNVALPAMARSFHEEAAQMSAVSVGYLVAVAVVIPASGWLGERFGTKRVLLTALAVFTGASVLCGAAGSLGELIAARVLQGLGGGALVPVGMTMLFTVFDQQERMRASRILTIPTTIAPASGPIVGGLLVDHASWRWVFLVNLPIGLLVLLFGVLFLKDTAPRGATRFDGAGFVMAALGFAGLMYGVSEGSVRGWASPQILGLGLGGLALIGVLIAHQLRVRQPLLDVRVYAERLFRTANLAILLGSAAFIGTLFAFPLMLQEAFGYDAVEAGLATMPEAIGIMLSAQVVSRVYGRVGPSRMMAFGLFGVAAVLVALSFADRGTDVWLLRAAMFVLGLFMANLFMPSQTAAFARIPKERTGRASTLFNAGRQLGMAAGTGVAGAVIAAIGPVRATAAGPVPNLTAYHAAFLVAAGLAVAGALIALKVRDADAASTLSRERVAALERRSRRSLPADAPSDVPGEAVPTAGS
ncbi:MFS transporter [Mangrovactinospora gilvigrisea]|uniref:MFS transporter n=1 Tax=Mangrovactinospora gilvigrisea TaxID=1428644 RepID=A0A1J7BCE4_9ACTN|nr:MDR family MFS transporter [Mangrovactinospora gilvigrisea]OIV36261.1 MFS transporter [Mangrovactinospora gilvigrisea]